MSNLKIVFDYSVKWDYIFLRRYIKKKIPVWIIEPFHAYHHKKGIRFFPQPLPAFVDKLAENKKVNVLTAELLKAKEIYQISADKAVSAVEYVFSEYKNEHLELVTYVSDTLKSPVAEDAFKKHLCNRLAEFYSVNILLHRVEKLLAPGPVMVYPDTDINSYIYFKSLLSRSNEDFFEHSNICFPRYMQAGDFLEDIKEYVIALSRLFAQTFASGLLA